MMFLALALQFGEEAPEIKNSELRKLERSYPLSYVVLFTSDDDCRRCDDALEEYDDAYQELLEFVDMYKFSCSKEVNAATCQKYGITKFPALRIFHHNGQMEAPAEYFGQFYSDQIEEFVWEKIREPFSRAQDTQALLDFMLTKALTGKHMFVVSEKRRAP